VPRLTVLTLLLAAAAALASAQVDRGAPDGDALDYEQQKALREYFETHDKIRDFGSKPLELFGDSKFTKFFSRYGDALLVIRVAGDFANVKGDEGVKKLLEEGTKKVMEKLAPNLMKVVGWMSWAKTGMELVKTFVYDPAVEGMNLERYATARRAGDNPRDAMGSTIAFGHMRLMALERFRQEHGQDIFQPGSKDTLLPEWEDKLHEFANAWFETEYQKKEIEEARQALLAEARRAQSALPSFDDELLEILRAQAAKDEARKPRPGGPEDFGRAGTGGAVRSDADTLAAACSALLASADAALRREDAPGAADALARAEGVCAGAPSALATLTRLRAALGTLEQRREQERKAEQLCQKLDADIAGCRFQQALAILDGLGATPAASCRTRRPEVERLIAQEAETVRLLRLAETATGTSLRQTRALLAQARAHAPACLAGSIDQAIALLDRNAAWQELLAEAPPPPVPAWLGPGASPPPPTEKAAGAPPSWLAPPSPSPAPAAAGEAPGNPPASVPGWLAGSTAAGSGKRPEEALDDARRTLGDEHRDEQARQRRLEEERRRQEQLRREAQERIDTEKRIADERQRAADEEERRRRAAAEKAAPERRVGDGKPPRTESVMEALNRALAQAVAAQGSAPASPEARTPPPTPRPSAQTRATPASSGDDAKRACVECVNALISGSCYVRVATLAGWGLCLTCSADGGVDPSNRFIEKNRCPMCANVSWDLCDFKPAPAGCVARCCSR
jgi:hypothetical protein